MSMVNYRTRLRRVYPVLLLVAAIVAALLAAVAGVRATANADTSPLDPNEPRTVSADALPTVQVNGVVWSQVIVGDRVYVTGEFTQARPAGAAAGANETPRSHILAYNLHTGELITSWAPSLNAQGLAITASADGSRIFVGGDFSQVSGVWRNRVAAIDAATGAVIGGWNPIANTRVSALAVMGDTLYMGGHFTIVAEQGRVRLAAVNATTGQLLPWAPSADRDVATMITHPGTGRVIVGGSFYQLNGTSQPGMGSIDAITGELMPWAANTVVTNAGPQSYISSLTTDGDRVYGVGWAYFAAGATANFEGIFSAVPSTGAIDWVNGCRGDNYGIAVTGDILYTAGHAHDCGMVDYLPQSNPWTWQRAIATDKRGSSSGLYNAYGPYTNWQAFAGRPAADTLHWLPSLAPGSYTGNTQAAYAVAANADYVVLGGEFPQVNGQGQQGLVRFVKKDLAPNKQGPLGVNAPTVTPMGTGAVRVGWNAHYDRDNERVSYEVLRGATVATSEVLTSFTADTNWWTQPRLGFVDTTAAPGSQQTYRIRVLDTFGNGGPSAPTTVTIPSGAAPSSAYRAMVKMNGAVNHWRLGEASGTVAQDWIGSNDLTVNGATRNVAGAMLNEGDRATSWPATTNTSTVRGASSWWQKGPQEFSIEAWFRTTTLSGGKIIGFGNSRTGRSSSTTTDRHIYMTNAGQLVFGVRPDYGTRRTISGGAALNNGQWHHVVAALGGSGGRLFIDGQQVAQDASLTKAQVYQGYWRLAGDQLGSWPTAPSAEAFGGTIDEVAVYPKALTLGQVRANYTASGRSGLWVNQPPVAAFTHSEQNLAMSVDGSGSSDVDGVIMAHAWDFGDGSTGTGATAQHIYTAPGTYLVKLTVTDNNGATGQRSAQVTVTAPDANAPFAADAFERSVDAGFGTAEVGGAWGLQGSASSFAVSGGAGRITGMVGGNRGAYLTETTRVEADVTADLSLNTAPSGGADFVSLMGRRVSNGNDYELTVRYMPDGTAIAYLRRALGGAVTVLSSTSLGAVAPGDVLKARVQVSGTDTTTVRGKVWRAGQAEPGSWLLTSAEATPAALNAAGHAGILQYVSSAWTGAAPTLTVDNFAARPVTG